MPLAVTSVGRAYLAALSDAAREPILDDIRRSDPVAWPKVRHGIENAINDVRKHGFCTSMGDWLREFHSVGVPLETQTPYGTLALSVGGLASSLPVARLETDLGPRLVTLARRVDELLRTTGFKAAWRRDAAPGGVPSLKHNTRKRARALG